jgi:hypothetical protein
LPNVVGPKRPGRPAPPAVALAPPTFVAVAPIELKPATLADTRAEVKLPGTVTAACVGGGGRYLVLHLGRDRQVAVVDVAECKVVKYIPIPEDDCKVAAGMDKLFIYAPTAGAVQRYDLRTFERTLTAPAPVQGKVAHLLMGSGSNGPLVFGCAGQFGAGGSVAVDPQTLRPVALELDPGRALSGLGEGTTARVSGDGRVFTSYTPGLSPQGHVIRVLTNAGLKTFSPQAGALMYGHLTPGPDGRHVFGTHGVFTAEGKPVGQLGTGYQGYSLPPADDGDYYLKLDVPGMPHGDARKPSTASIYRIGDDRPVARLAGAVLPSGIRYWGRERFEIDQRVYLFTFAKVLAVIPDEMDRVVFYRADVEKLLDAAGIDYLFVTSKPPVAVPGKPFRYPVGIKSNKGGVKLKLEAGPGGMKVNGTTVTWDVPKNYDGKDANVILTVSDASGQEVFHTFSLSTAGR